MSYLISYLLTCKSSELNGKKHFILLKYYEIYENLYLSGHVILIPIEIQESIIFIKKKKKYIFAFFTTGIWIRKKTN